MLALGALSTGCLVEMGQYLPQLFPFLIQVSVSVMMRVGCVMMRVRLGWG